MTSWWHEYVTAAERMAELPTRADLEFEQLESEQQRRVTSTRKRHQKALRHAVKVEDNSDRFRYLARPTLAQIVASSLLTDLEPSPSVGSAPALDVSQAAGQAERALTDLEQAVAAEVALRARRARIRGWVMSACIILLIIFAALWIF